MPCLCGYDPNCKMSATPHGLPRSQIKDCSNPGTPSNCELVAICNHSSITVRYDYYIKFSAYINT